MRVWTINSLQSLKQGKCQHMGHHDRARLSRRLLHWHADRKRFGCTAGLRDASLISLRLGGVLSLKHMAAIPAIYLNTKRSYLTSTESPSSRCKDSAPPASPRVPKLWECLFGRVLKVEDGHQRPVFESRCSGRVLRFSVSDSGSSLLCLSPASSFDLNP